MAGTNDRMRAIDGLQGVSALVGITLGVIPLVGWAMGTESGGLLGLVFGWSPSGTSAYVLPVVVVVAAIGVIAALEMVKRHA